MIRVQNSLPLVAATRKRDAHHAPFSPVSPALKRAIESETRLRASRGFDEQFFARLDEKRARNRTFRGQIERFCQNEIGGVAVWRLFGSTLAGAFFPALVLACCLVAPPQNGASPSIPREFLALTPFNQRKFWEEAAWKTPSGAQFWALLDPNFAWGGDSCASPLVA